MPDIGRNTPFYSDGTTGTSADLNGEIIDLADFEGILAIAHLSATNASVHLKIQTGTASGAMSDTTGEVPGTLTTLYLDQYRPGKRYARAVLKGATTTGSFRSLVTIPYGARSLPTTNDASTTGLITYTPGSGTATG